MPSSRTTPKIASPSTSTLIQKNLSSSCPPPLRFAYTGSRRQCFFLFSYTSTTSVNSTSSSLSRRRRRRRLKFAATTAWWVVLRFDIAIQRWFPDVATTTSSSSFSPKIASSSSTTSSSGKEEEEEEEEGPTTDVAPRQRKHPLASSEKSSGFSYPRGKNELKVVFGACVWWCSIDDTGFNARHLLLLRLF